MLMMTCKEQALNMVVQAGDGELLTAWKPAATLMSEVKNWAVKPGKV